VAATTSLPREAFLRSARSVLHHLREGDIYQANLTQRFRCPAAESAEGLFRRLRESAPAPRAALVRAGGRALVSVSPETFVDIAPDGFARTVPIKGTRPRGADPAADAAAVADLESSAKDRAELLMIVDLERNDLGRVSETGSVSVPELMAVRTYPAIHHLVATVTSRLRPGVGPQEWLAAVFPGGSVTGAPKRRAMEILASLEPVPRGWYTGALIWFDDDGWTRSSILIRSVVTHRGVAYVGSGGGIVVDSDPEAEWLEANHKARPLARALGFEPEEAR
jgi:para-aminobenzoate synthetase component 1